MAESDFSWLKMASFIGVCLLWVLASVVFAAGIRLITAGAVFHGVATVISGIVCVVSSIVVYKNYQKKSLERRKQLQPERATRLAKVADGIAKDKNS